MSEELHEENIKKLTPQNENNRNGDSDFEFMREKIKNRPVNRRKLLRRTMTTAGMAFLFGLIACVTFLFLEPVVSDWLNPEENLVSEVTFPEEEEEEEMKFEDLIIEEEIPVETPKEEMINGPTIVEQRVSLEVADYSKLYTKLYSVADTSMHSMVLVSGVSKESDWMSYTYDTTKKVSGMIIADNGQELLIVSSYSGLEKATSIVVTFYNNIQYEAEILAKDKGTGLCVLGVPLSNISEITLDKIAYATLGNSNSSALVGSLVIAIGAPMGNYGSIGYGMVTGKGNLIQTADVNYKFFTTDIYCSQMATGVVINTKGQVLGFIDQSKCSSDMRNQLCVVGISELKKTIERLSNVDPRIYSGIQGMDVTLIAHESYGVPYGAYVTGVEIDSPAMSCGIQSGDVVVKFGDKDIASFSDYTTAVREHAGDDEVKVVVMRFSGEEYKEMEVELVLKERED